MLIDSTGKRRRRRSHPIEFKKQVIAACRQPGVSIAAIALEYKLNANLVRRWLLRAERVMPSEPAAESHPETPLVPAPTTLVPVTVKPVEVPAPTGEIRIVIQRPQRTIKITWPVAQSAQCVEALRELLR